jgi:DNA polymerase (family 10)
MINNEIIAKKLEEYALLLELKGEDLFKIRAYKKAAENIRKFEGNLVELLKSDKPAFHIEGIGTHIFQKVSSIIEKGSFKELDELKLEIPESLFELFRIPSLGPKKIYRLYKELGINNIRELEYACQEHRLKGLKGFGDKIQDQIVQGIAFIKKTEGRRLYTEVEPVAKTLEDLFKGVSGVTNVAVAGSYRRRLETIKDLDIVITSEDENISKKIQALSVCEHIKERGEKKISFLIDNLPVDVRFFDTSDFYTALHHLTGSKSHHEKLRAIAKSCGYKLNEYGLYKDNIKIKINTEKKIYDILGLKYIIPEMREGLFEFDLVIDENEIVNVNDIKGILHIHSNYSDGINTCEDIVQDSIKKGFKFIGISDHSKSAYYAGGLGADDLKRQADEIKKIQEEFPDIMILHGV